MADLKVLAGELIEKRTYPLLILKMGVEHHCILRIQQELGDDRFPELDVILQTEGGSIEAAYLITKVLRKHADKINVIVPLFAKSAGTLICLGADQLLLSDISELGPLDPQMPESQEGDTYTHKSALNGFKALDQLQRKSLEHLDLSARYFMQDMGLRTADSIKYAIDFVGVTCGQLYTKINPKEIGEYARELEVGERYATSVLHDYMGWDEAKAAAFARTLVFNYPSHGFVIDLAELSRIGFESAKELNADEIAITDKIRTLFIKQESSIIKLFKSETNTPPQTSITV